VKADNNPIIEVPPAIHHTDDFRDPATAWLEDDGVWRSIIGTKVDNADGTMDGMALLYKSSDFRNWELEENSYLHKVAGSGMWECVDFYPVTIQNELASCLNSTENVGKIMTIYLLSVLLCSLPIIYIISHLV
jgi:beta-fructofuranosidase